MQLTDAERQRIAMALRAAAYQSEQDAQKQASPTVRETFESEARAYAALAEKLGRMR